MMSGAREGDGHRPNVAIPMDSSLFDSAARVSVGGESVEWDEEGADDSHGVDQEFDQEDGGVSYTRVVPRTGLFDEQAALLSKDVDVCTSKLKHDVLTAFSRAKMEVDEYYTRVFHEIKAEHRERCEGLQSEIDQMTELIESYVQSAAAKDQVILNMKQEVESERANSLAKARDLEEKELAFDQHCERINAAFAERHYQTVLLRKVFRGFHGQVKSKWKSRMERACKARAQEVCTRLQEKHDLRERTLVAQLEAAQAEIAAFHDKRKEFQEGMRKAFLRGVSALNTEALSVFPDEIVAESHMFGSDGGPIVEPAREQPRLSPRTAAAAAAAAYPPYSHGSTRHPSYDPPSEGAAYIPPESAAFPREAPSRRALVGGAPVSSTRRAARVPSESKAGRRTASLPQREGSVRVERHAPRQYVRVVP